MTKGRFDLGDMKEQLIQMQQMGGMGSLMDKLPGMGNIPQSVKNKVIDESQSKLMIAIIDSMTPKERTHIKLIKGSRKQRIANGSGTNIQQVNKLLKQFEKMQKTMKKIEWWKNEKDDAADESDSGRRGDIRLF